MSAVKDSSHLASGDFAGAFALLAEMTQGLAESLDIDATLERALERIVAHLDAVVGALWLIDEETEDLVCRASVGSRPITGMRLPLTQGVVGRCVRDNRCATVLDVEKDSEFAREVDEQSGFVTRSILCAPLSFSVRPLGAIQIVNKRSDDACFSESDIHPLRVLASSAALAIANARMAAAAVDHERVRRELELAAEIQQNLLPSPLPRPFPIHGVNVPARSMSGDFFDILPLEGGRIAFCLGDVSGKGMNAALLMAKTVSLYRCLAKTIDRPGRLLSILNDEIFETATRGMFVTMVAGVYETRAGRIRLANAGHEPLLRHTRSGEFEAIPAGAPPLGIARRGEVPETEVQLDGDSLYTFSDGLTEACSKTGEQLGSKGLQRLIARSTHLSLAGRVDAIIGFVKGLELRDDLTLLAICGDCDCVDGRVNAECVLALRIAASVDQLRKIREAVREAVESCGCSAECTADVVMAVDEACQNVIRHAYGGDPGGAIELMIERCGEDLVISLRDFARKVDPKKVKPRDLDEIRPGGLGTHLIREMVDSADFVRPESGEGNLLRMVKRIR